MPQLSSSPRRGLVCALAAGSLLLGLLVPTTIQTHAAEAREITLTPYADSYVSTREPTWTHGGRTSLYATTDETHAFLKFPTFRQIPAGYRVTGAWLDVYVRENNKPQGVPVVSTASNVWSESTLVLSNRPASQGAPISSPVSAPVSTWVSIPLNNPGAAIKGDDDSSFEVSYSQHYSNFRIDSKESSNVPKLRVRMEPVDNENRVVAPSAPAPAAAAGYHGLAFNDDFNSLDTIDLTGTGVAGKNWYTDRPFGYGRLNPNDLSVSDGVLTIDQTGDDSNLAISSVSARTRTGQSFQYGYYEARLSFDPANATRSWGYPSFWTISRDHLERPAAKSVWTEFDIFEAYHWKNQEFEGFFTGSVHEFGTDGRHYMNSGNNTYKLPGTDWKAFHTYGALWTPGKVTWYFDGRPLLTQTYGANEYPSPNYYNNLPRGTFDSLSRETNGMALLLGTARNNPVKVDYVRVWR